MASLTIRMNDDLKQRLHAQAVRNGRSMAEEVRQMLREALMHQQPSPPAVAPEFYGTYPCSANNLTSPKTGES
ncbi:FitA-like ribbon-helix-helix domain-containing protein [Pseudomonas sediminis]|uniref:Ribbon-helix-helix protein, CopG family n=1 Tax=Pseudomonas sediminis TaxID=1691904 RepID=A0ABX6SFW7_9PSED|nr:ribbon-helix-helix protein, CopG family [Pseudomonas sediminis]QNH00396.1 ribbon-helix-helix protein, CopG family [Pseudomonas sediminis]